MAGQIQALAVEDQGLSRADVGMGPKLFGPGGHVGTREAVFFQGAAGPGGQIEAGLPVLTTLDQPGHGLAHQALGFVRKLAKWRQVLGIHTGNTSVSSRWIRDWGGRVKKTP